MDDDEARRRAALKLRTRAMDWFSRQNAEASVRKISQPTKPLPRATVQGEVTILNVSGEEQVIQAPAPAAEPAPEPAESLDIPPVATATEPVAEPAPQEAQPEPVSVPQFQTIDAPEEKAGEQELAIIADLISSIDNSHIEPDRKPVFTNILNSLRRNLEAGVEVRSLPSFVRNLHSKPELTDAVEHVLKRYSINNQSYLYLWGLDQ